MIAITSLHNNSRLLGTLSFLDSGAQEARLCIYGCPRPATPYDIPEDDLLVEIPLTKPAGVIVDNALHLTGQEALVSRTGVAVWARVINGAGVTAMDMSCSDADGDGDCKLSSTTLYLGGIVRLVSAVLL